MFLRVVGVVALLLFAVEAEARPKRAPPIDPVARALGVGANTAPSLTPEQKHVAHDAGSRLVSLCPDCRLATIAEEGPCGWARTNRRIIASAAAAGLDADTIVGRYVATYGEEVLAADTSEGRYVLTWVVPYVLIGVGLFVVFVVARRRRETTSALPEPDRSYDPRISEMLDDELAQLD